MDSTAPEPPRNVLMISIDTTRRDHIDRYATDGVVRTPFLSRLLAEGLALDDHQQCSNWTFESTSCTLEGRMNEDTGWLAKMGPTRTPVPAGRRTLAVRLAEQGFHTILVSSNEWLTDTWNNAQGYAELSRETTADTAALLGKGRELLAAASPDRWLLHVHLVQAHSPYTPPDPYDDEAEALPPIPWDLDTTSGHYGVTSTWPDLTPEEQDLLARHLEARYTGELRVQDDQLAAWWATMDQEGWLDDTLVVLWTDHGEQFFERGDQGHAFALGGEENDAVLGFWSKGMAPLAWTEPTHAIDLVPTVLDRLGLPSADEDLHGFPVGTAPADRARFSSTVTRLGPQVAVTRGDWKLRFDFDGPIWLHDRATDPTEQVDRYSPTDPVVLELWDLLEPRVEKVASLTPEWPLTWPADLPH